MFNVSIKGAACMKGIILKCLAEMIVKNHGGEGKWGDILAGAGLDRKLSVMPPQDVDDGAVMNVLGSTC